MFISVGGDACTEEEAGTNAMGRVTEEKERHDGRGR